MRNFLFITTCLGLCVSISAQYARDCVTPFLSKKDHPQSICVKVERCPELLQYYKEQFDNGHAKKLMADVLCNFNGHETCCPLSWILKDEQSSAEKPDIGSCGKSKWRERINSGRVIGGKEAEVGDFPWMAALGKIKYEEKIWFCGGSIISKRHILTAAHCIHRKTKESLLVRVGDLNLNETVADGVHPKDFDVEKITIHRDYSDYHLTKDIAVLTLKGNIIFDQNIQPICLPSSGGFSLVGKNTVVAGWGYNDNHQSRSTHLHYVQLPVLDTSACIKKYHTRWNSVIPDEIVCAGYEPGGRDSCQGDSGGPLMFNHGGVFYIIGIVSYGQGCALKNTPAIYTKVSAFLNWIES